MNFGEIAAFVSLPLLLCGILVWDNQRRAKREQVKPLTGVVQPLPPEDGDR